MMIPVLNVLEEGGRVNGGWMVQVAFKDAGIRNRQVDRSTE